MREIKFRAWDIQGQRMMEHLETKNHPLWWIVDTLLPLMQFTGLKDKNGKEIYEGDIVNRYDKGTPLTPPIMMKIYWNEASCGWSLIGGGYNMHMSNICILDVIGNIYDNPELIK